VQYGSAWAYVLELACVDLHDHINGDDAQEIEAAMPRVDGRSRYVHDVWSPVNVLMIVKTSFTKTVLRKTR
jgi:hypothetical protein